jgi:uncharacterized repeat protein (TIGR03803 family)
MRNPQGFIENLSSNFRVLGFALALLSVLTIIAVQESEAQTFSVLHTFTGGRDGGAPTGVLALDRGGHIYGTTSQGGYPNQVCGTARCGTVFELSERNSYWTLITLYSFFGDSDGSTPYAGVTIGPNGTLYGTTFSGGGDGGGTVFNLRPPVHTSANTRGGWIEAPIYRFRGPSDGAEPGYGSLIFDPMGNIYGTTFQGGLACGDGECGAVFKLAPSDNGSWTETAYDFPGRSYGGNPLGGVVMDSSGNLYGTTTNINYDPVAYELTLSASGWIETTLYTFTFNDNYPGGEGVILSAGNLFGANLSAAYELTPAGGQWDFSILYNFTGDSGSWGTLASDSDGNLYGTTCSGGTLGQGSVFKLSPSQNGWIESDLHDFTGTTDGGCPIGGVTLDETGNIYGTAAWGASGYGVVWEITPQLQVGIL